MNKFFFSFKYHLILAFMFTSLNFVHAMDQEEHDSRPAASSSYFYESLEDLRSKVRSEIKFTHGLSEFTLIRMSPSAEAFFQTHGRFIDSEGRSASGIEIVNGFAIGKKSKLGHARAGNVLLGHDIKSGTFYAFKPYPCAEKAEALTFESQEILILKKLNRFVDSLESLNEEGEKVRYIVLELVDGVTIDEMCFLRSPKINDHARYLIVYNLAQELLSMYKMDISQRDPDWSNFMVKVSDFSFKAIDFAVADISEDQAFRCLYPVRIFLEQIFGARDEALKKYALGSFEEFFNEALSSSSSSSYRVHPLTMAGTLKF